MRVRRISRLWFPFLLFFLFLSFITTIVNVNVLRAHMCRWIPLHFPQYLAKAACLCAYNTQNPIPLDSIGVKWLSPLYWWQSNFSTRLFFPFKSVCFFLLFIESWTPGFISILWVVSTTQHSTIEATLRQYSEYININHHAVSV